jgi:DNA-directed RNA polymerase subunit beta'
MNDPTLAQLRLARILPKDLYQPGDPLNKKEQQKILTQIAKNNPDKYKQVVEALNEVGLEVARLDGTSSIGIEDIAMPARAKVRRTKMREQIEKMLDSSRDKQLPRADIHRKIMEVLAKNVADDVEEIYQDSKAEKNPLAIQVDNAGRGNKSSIAAIRGGELVAKDSYGKLIPILLDRSYSQGLTPMQYMAGQEAARIGVVDTKLSVASSGYVNKTMSQAVHRLVVSALDDESAVGRGLAVPTDDRDNDGAALSFDYGPYKRNTIITPKIRKNLIEMGHDEIVVRSPIASGAKDGGVLAWDLGERNYGRLPELGEYANLAASNSIGEAVTQATLNSKHNSNVSMRDIEALDDENRFTLKGFELIDRVINPSGEQRGFAVHAESDGRVGLIRPAPQGGHYVMIGLKQHYVLPGFKINVKPGEEVEAGQQLTEGIPNHAAVTKLRGIGEGRRAVVEAMTRALKENGQKGYRRNLEILARGLVDRVRMTDEYGDFIPDDVVPYHRLEATWKPREDSYELQTDRAIGKFLEKPVLHYSIGTPIKPSMVKTLQKHGIKSLVVNEAAPPFEPTVVRAVDLMQTDPDWMTRQLGGHGRRSFEEAVMRGRDSDTSGTSYVGSRAELVSFNRGNSTVKLDEPAPGTPILPR